MKSKLILLFAVAFASLANAQSSSSPTAIILDRYDAEIFPESWRSSPINAYAQPLAEADRPKCLAILEAAVAKYPAAILNAHLKKVYVLGSIEYRGVRAGGTNSRTTVYLVKNEKFSEKQFELNFHAEFSSILLRNAPAALDQEAWQKANPETFSYGKGGVNAIQEGQASLRLLKELHEEGFLHQYAKASLQEDFNSYAARLFVGDKALWEAVRDHPKVKQKAALAIAFYQKLDASFTEEFFKSLSKP